MTSSFVEKSLLKKRSITLAGHRTSVTLEDIFWEALKEISEENKMPLSKLVEKIDIERTSSLSGALRVYVALHFMQKIKK